MALLDAPTFHRAAAVGVAAVALLGVGAAAVVGRFLNRLLKVPLPMFLLVPSKVPGVLRPVTTVVHVVLMAAAQVVQGYVRRRLCHGNDGHTPACVGRGAVGAVVTPRGCMGNVRLWSGSKGHELAL